MERTNYITAVAAALNETAMPEESKASLARKILELENQNLNLLLVGCTGSGKSSTINMLFDMEKAVVGIGADPETMTMDKYELGNLTIWDSPGLGDGKEADEHHKECIANKLREKDEDGKYLIDLVMVILDGGSKDMGTSYMLINDVVIPNLGEDPEKRIVVAVNKADMAQSGRNWDFEHHCPLPALMDFLDSKAASVKDRIKEASGLDVEVICYSAGFKAPNLPQEPSYNLSLLLLHILKHIPVEKRVVLAEHLNEDPENFKSNDTRSGFSIVERFVDAFREVFEDCVWEGEFYGMDFGTVGEVVGKGIGGLIGILGGAFAGIGSMFLP